MNSPFSIYLYVRVCVGIYTSANMTFRAINKFVSGISWNFVSDDFVLSARDPPARRSEVDLQFVTKPCHICDICTREYTNVALYIASSL